MFRVMRLGFKGDVLESRDVESCPDENYLKFFRREKQNSVQVIDLDTGNEVYNSLSEKRRHG